MQYKVCKVLWRRLETDINGGVSVWDLKVVNNTYFYGSDMEPTLIYI